jgi:phosphopantothenoylcysteine decarboxylase / phosphopantothenate---cysteine ligase
VPSEATLAGRSVTLGVTGCIAAYKAGEIVRLLRRMDVRVQVVMTEAATQLMSVHALATLSENPVATSLWGRPEMDHIQLSREADLMVIAPATANILGKVASGVADDLLSTAIMASNVPVVFAPAMNVQMWENPAVQHNIAVLRERGYGFIPPETGELACGETGTGRMADPRTIVDAAVRLMLARAYRLNVVVTAGPTEEAFDAVRVLTNRSSGKMGVALAEAARDLGHRVTFITGPLRCDPPLGVERVDVTTAEQMLAQVQAHEGQAELLIMTAAVSDYRPAVTDPGKLPSGRQNLSISFVPNPDILAAVVPARRERGAVTVGFALEVGEDGEARARRKLDAKGVDLIVHNDATRPDSAFGGDTTRVTLFFRDGRIDRLETMPKTVAAREILLRAEALCAAPE